MTTDSGADALQKSTLDDELVESTTIEEPESTVRTESDGAVAEEMVRESMMKSGRILVTVKTNLKRVKKILVSVMKILMYSRKNTADNLTFNEGLAELVNGDLDAIVDKLS